MNMSVRLAVGAAALSFVGLTASPALAVVCDPYSQECVEPSNQGSGVGAQQVGTPAAVRSDTSPATLPFTGGELVLLSTVGAAALAGGVALTVAGRRRSARV